MPRMNLASIMRTGSVSQRATAILVLVIIGWVLIGGIMPCFFGDNQGERGTFGDQFGAANALFSALAFGMIVVTLWQQDTTLKATLILALMENMNTVAWGDAHREIAAWARICPDFATKFKERREIEGSDEYKIDRARRAFVDPYHKLLRLYDAGVIDRTLAAAIMTPDVCWTLYYIVRHLEQGIREHTDRMGPFVLALFTEKELQEKGRYRGSDNSIEQYSQSIWERAK